MSYLKSMFDAPQRKACFEALADTSFGTCTIEFHIQGVHVVRETRSQSFSFTEMADAGCRRWHERPLTLWQRLFRVPARVGSIEQIDPHRVMITMWSDPELTFVLDGQLDGMQKEWRVAHSIIQAAGFELRKRAPK